MVIVINVNMIMFNCISFIVRILIVILLIITLGRLRADAAAVADRLRAGRPDAAALGEGERSAAPAVEDPRGEEGPDALGTAEGGKY